MNCNMPTSREIMLQMPRGAPAYHAGVNVLYIKRFFIRNEVDFSRVLLRGAVLTRYSYCKSLIL